jgi:undecaprenyl diphosphate synthase
MSIPLHLAVIMDGNGRWAKRRMLPRSAGHKRGADAVRTLLQTAHAKGVRYLTVFAFSSENWKRPQDEVDTLMDLFASSLARESASLHANGVRLRFVGDRARFDIALRQQMADAEALTASNSGIHFTVAVNYGGQWDIAQAASRLAERGITHISEESLAAEMSLAFAPDVDLLIRTGGEHRISNFLLWQCAYSELYFTETLWPDFDADELDKALIAFSQRERRFGQTSEQVRQAA